MSATGAQGGTVYLVGAGPGDPELLTVRALRLLQTADVVLHDDLVSEAVLELVSPTARVTSVGKRCGQARITQTEIHALMIEAARTGAVVVRLKSGDPLIFGRAGEEIEALTSAGIPFAIVPGVTAALAAGAALALPYTERSLASKLVFLTGHHATEKGADTPVWEGTVPPDATLVIYMPGRDLGRLARELMAAGVEPNVLCAAVSRAATPQQSQTLCRVNELGSVQVGTAPLLVIVGPALERIVRPG